MYFLTVLILFLAVSFSGTDSLSVSDRVCGNKFPVNLIKVVPEDKPDEISQENKIRTIRISLNQINLIMASASVVRENFPMFKTLFKSCVQGSFSQNDPRFGDSAGMQCAFNTLASLCWSVNRKVNIWKTFDLDFVLTKGNEIFEFVNLKRSLYFDELPKDFQYAGIEFKIEFSRVDNGFFREETNSFDVFFDKNFFFSDNIGGALLFFQGYTVSLLKDNKRNIYVFDSHGRDNCGQPLPNGKSILMSFISPQDMLQYFTTTYENITHIQIVYIKVHSLDEERKNSLLKAFSLYKRQIQSIAQSKQRKERSKTNYPKKSELRKEQFKTNYAENSEQRKEQRKTNYAKNSEQEKAQRKTNYAKNSEQEKAQRKTNYAKNSEQEKAQRKTNYAKNSEQEKDRSKTNYVKNCEKRKKQFRANYVKNAKKTKDQSMPKCSQDRINKFKLNIRQGPYFICVVCNRSLYNRSVKLFKIEKYEILHDKSLSLVKSLGDIF